MKRSRATRILVLVSLSCFSNSRQPRRSYAFFIDACSPTVQRAVHHLARRPLLPPVFVPRGDSFEGACLPGSEHDGKFVDETFPLADDGCAVCFFFSELRRDLLALPCRDVAFFARAENAVNETGTSDQANLAGVQRCERPSTDYGWLRSKNSCGLPGRQRRLDQVLQLVERQPFECERRRAGRRHGIWIFAEIWQLR